MDCSKTKPKRQTLRIERIQADPAIQCRVGIDEPTVADYQRDIECGAKLPAIDVFFDGINSTAGGLYWIGDGFHRHLAHQRAGKAHIECVIHRGTREDALWFAIGANQKHGLRRTVDDKRKAVKAALLNPAGVGLSDSQIAEHVGVSHPLVGKVRKGLEESGQLETVTSRTGADGRTRNVSKIGKTKPKPADNQVAPIQPDQDVEPEFAPCPNCGNRTRNENGDCAKCKDPCENGVQVDQPEPKVRGAGIQLAHEAIACMKRIGKNDPLRTRAWEIVRDWLDFNE